MQHVASFLEERQFNPLDLCGFFRGCLSDCRKGAIEQSQHELSFLQPRFGVPVDSDAVYTFATALDKIGGAD